MMKLKIENSVPDLKQLELGEVYLFSEHSKSVLLIIREDNSPRIAVSLKNEVHYFSLNERDKAQELYEKSYVITDDIYKDNKKFIDFIKNCVAGVRYKYSDNKQYIEIDIDNDGTFHWTYSNRGINYYPMRNSQYIKTFKTEMGAKLSLIKYLGLE